MQQQFLSWIHSSEILYMMSPYIIAFSLIIPVAVVSFALSARRKSLDNSSTDLLSTTPTMGFVSTPNRSATPATPLFPTPTTPEPTVPMILVVDDSLVVRKKLEKLLTESGFSVQVCSDGLQALDALQKHHVNLVITDLQMPNMDGFELIAHIQGDMNTEHIPIIAITGHQDLQAQVHQVQGLFGIFQKPWNDRALVQRAHTLCKIQPTAESLHI